MKMPRRRVGPWKGRDRRAVVSVMNLVAPQGAVYGPRMSKRAVEVVAEPSFFASLADVAATYDRSPSWLLGRCLATQRAALESLDRATLAGAGGLPKRGVASRRYFIEREVFEAFEAARARLEVSFDDVVRWAFERSRPLLAGIAS